MDKLSYTIKAEGWLEDAAGIGAHRMKGQTVSLTAVQAEYLLMSGQIELKAPKAAAAPVKGDSKS